MPYKVLEPNRPVTETLFTGTDAPREPAVPHCVFYIHVFPQTALALEEFLLPCNRIAPEIQDFPSSAYLPRLA